jgi:predicted NAD/FAD-binding protein
VRIGIIGAGVSGMTAAWMLQDDHEVTLIDAAPRLGGHVETLPIVVDGITVHAELGPRFFFDTAYPYFLALLRLLGVPLRWSDARASFTNVALGHTVVLPPRSLREVASLVRSPRLTRHMLSLRRLIEEQPVIAARRDFSITFRRHLAEQGYPPSFGPEFAYPFLAGCWGAPLSELPDFPVYSLLKGMPPGSRPGFYEIDGGMSRYVEAFGRELTKADVRLGAGVRRIERRDDFHVEDTNGVRLRFDRLIVATSARDAARLVSDVPAAAAMQAALASFRFFEIEIVVHGDPSFMPPHRGDWAHNNLFVDGDATWMSDWQGLRGGVPVIRTWLRKGRALPEPLYAQTHRRASGSGGCLGNRHVHGRRRQSRERAALCRPAGESAGTTVAKPREAARRRHPRRTTSPRRVARGGAGGRKRRRGMTAPGRSPAFWPHRRRLADSRSVISG